MQNTIDILEILGSVLVGISFIPQTYEVIKNKVKNISKWFILINLISSGFDDCLWYYKYYYSYDNSKFFCFT